jgi:hypothetical protein
MSIEPSASERQRVDVDAMRKRHSPSTFRCDDLEVKVCAWCGSQFPYPCDDLKLVEQQTAELGRAREIAKTAVWMLREHERVARLVNQPPWFIAPMSRTIGELDALASGRGEQK